jgi:hypothetical protein
LNGRYDQDRAEQDGQDHPGSLAAQHALVELTE